MRLRFTGAGLATVLAMALLPFKAGGCSSNTACITMSASAYAKAGQCPSIEEVAEFFTEGCDVSIASVDGEGTYADQLCCYPVTELSSNNSTAECFGGGFGTGGFAGAGGGFPTCTTCADQIGGEGSFDLTALCVASNGAWLDLELCACTACDMLCGLNLCEHAVPTTECLSCAAESCGAELDACEHH